MKKIFKYQGKTIAELKELSVKEFAKLVPSRQRRSLERGFTEAEQKLLDTVRKGQRAKTHCRTLVILPELVGQTIHIHNGKAFQALIIQEEMIGHRLGEFALTRKRVAHSSPGIGATRSSSALSVR